MEKLKTIGMIILTIGVLVCIPLTCQIDQQRIQSLSSQKEPEVYQSVGAEREGSMAKCYFKEVYGHKCIWCYKNGGSRIDSAVGSLSCDWNK